MNSIIIFYKYVQIPDPQAIITWQKILCTQLQFKGRVLIAAEGINATLGGLTQHINTYKEAMNNHELFKEIDFKESLNTQDHFPRLRIVLKKEIVHIGLDPHVATADQAGTHLDPAQAHALLQKKPKDLVIIDCRNPYESAIGTIPGALRPNVPHFRDFPAYIDNNLDQLKDKEILMYCTAGVRCERASAYIKLKGVAKNVFQIKGGVHRYIEQFPNGFFRGKNYVFDGRTAVKVTDDILANCLLCNAVCDDYTNCLHAACNKHYIGCATCLTAYDNMCSVNCFTLVTQHGAPKRPNPIKVYNERSDSKK